MGERPDEVRRDPTAPDDPFLRERPISETPAVGDGPFDPATDAFRPDAADPTLPVTDEEIDEEVVAETDEVDEVEVTRIEIEQTRAEMSETVNAIQERLSPESLKEQAKDRVREATVGRAEQAVSDAGDRAKEAGSSLVDTIRENPVPSALTGIGLAWLLMNRREGSASRQPRYDYYGYERTPYGYRPYEPAASYDEEPEGSAAGRVVGRTRDKVGEAAVGVQDKAGELADRAQDRAEQVGERARQTGSTLADTIRENPVPVALAGIGLGWLLMGNRRQQAGQPSLHRRRYPYYGESTAGGGSAGEALGQARERAGETAGRVQEKAGETAGQIGEKAGELAERTQEGADRLADRTQTGARRANEGLQRVLRENPLAVGALAVGVGAAVGLAVPETRKEHEVMGEARDNLLDRAQEKAQETKQKVQRVAEEAQNAAREEADSQGLTDQ